MTIRRPLSLSDQQLAIVLAHARTVSPERRDHYLRAVADQLMPNEQVEDAVVEHACDRAKAIFSP